MPKKLEDCVAELLKKGYTKEQAYAICTASIQQNKENEQAKKNKPRTLNDS